MNELLAGVLDSFRLTENSGYRFSGPNVPLPWYWRIFGGQMLGQAMIAAADSAPGKQVKSIQITFLAEGDPGQEVTYEVDPVHTGRTFATRLIAGSQGARHLLTATVTLHSEEDGLDHQISPANVPEPDSLPSTTDAAALPVELRAATDGDQHPGDVGEPWADLWLRVPDKVDDELLLHQAILAYCSDSPMMGTGLRPHPGVGLGAMDRVRSAVISHSVWFHRPFRIDDWLLFSHCSPSAHGGRMFCRGDWYTEGGVIVASCAQEGMLRLAP